MRIRLSNLLSHIHITHSVETILFLYVIASQHLNRRGPGILAAIKFLQNQAFKQFFGAGR